MFWRRGTFGKVHEASFFGLPVVVKILDLRLDDGGVFQVPHARPPCMWQLQHCIGRWSLPASLCDEQCSVQPAACLM